jgi:hypothetical protein
MIARQFFLLGLYLAHRHNFPIQAHPTAGRWTLTIAARFLFGSEALSAFSLAVFRGRLDDHCRAPGDAEAAPARLAILLRFLRCRIALQAFLPGLGLGHLDNFSIEADPALGAVLLRFFLGTVALGISLPRLGLSYLHDSSIKTDPALPAVSLCFLLGRIALQVLLLSLYPRHLDSFSIQADPAILWWWWWSLATGARFLFGCEALALSLALRPGGLDHFAVDAGPPTRLAILDCCFFGRETWRSHFLRVRSDRLNDLPIGTSPTRFAAALRVAGIVKTREAFCLTIRLGSLNNFLIQAIPVRTATLDRFFRRLIASASVRFTLGLPPHVHDTFDTGVAPFRQVV